MAPGYVHTHPRVLDNCEHWDDEGRVALTVELAMSLPTQIARSARNMGWRSWGRRDEQWIEPYDNDGPAAFTTLFVRVPLPQRSLPVPNYNCRAPHLDATQLAVHAICDLINSKIEPIMADLSGQ